MTGRPLRYGMFAGLATRVALTVLVLTAGYRAGHDTG